MAERGNSKHEPILDEKMQHETRDLQNATQSPHAEGWRETEPVPDQTDSPEVQEAFAPGPGGQERADAAGDADAARTPAEPETGEEP